MHRWIPDGRVPRLALLVGVLAAATGLGGWVWSTFRTTTTPVSIADLIENFDDIAGDILAVEGLADPGVYVYATSGSEKIDALTAPERRYPLESALVVTASGCGVRVEWRPVEERVEWWELCAVDGGVALVRYGGVHEFFGTRDERTLQCPVGTWLLPPRTAVPVTVSRCDGGGMAHVRTLEVIGPASVDVGGTPTTGIEVRIATLTSGTATGEGTTRLVLSPRGLPLLWEEDSTGRSDTPIGIVTQREKFRLALASLEPRR